MQEPHPRFVPLEQLPYHLRDLPQPPAGLYVVGEVPRGPAVAVVGTRHPTTEGVKYTFRLVRALVEEGIVVVSGGAEGIDGAAHQAALQAGGTTVVVAPAGWARPYPESHAALFRDIVAGGGSYVSLAAPEIAAQRSAFFPRNAVLVALSHGVVVVQAGLRSGARNASKHARVLGRALWAVPSCPWVSEGAGCNVEIQLGARILTSVRDILGEVSAMGLRGVAPLRQRTQLGLFGDELSGADSPHRDSQDLLGGEAGFGDAADPPQHPPSGAESAATLKDCVDPTDLALLAAVARGVSSVDGLCDELGLQAPSVQVALLRLSLEGRVRVLATGRVCLVCC